VKKWRLVAMAALAVLVVVPGPASASQPGRTPVVLFPAFHLTKLKVTVHNQTTAPGCPVSGSFEEWFQNDHPSTTFSQVCQDKLETLRYNANPHVPMPLRFAEQPGVDVQVIDYGRTQSAPFYEPMYKALESAGYVRNKDIRVSGYDARLTPDMAGFLHRSKNLVEDTYRQNGNTPVELVGHSNGPLYIQYLLTHTTRAWRAKYVHGFTPLAGNFPGQGSLYSILFTGLNVQDFGYPSTSDNAASSVRMYQTLPSTYMSASDPKIFGDREVVVSSNGRDYTPRDYPKLFADAHLPASVRQIADHYIGFVKFADAFPKVDVTAEKGSGLPTIVGASLPNLTVGQVIVPAQYLNRDGDANQEDLTNDAIQHAWSGTPCFHFTLTDNPGVDHFSLPGNTGVLSRLLTELHRPRTHC
jgi:lecithin-cholesterol acyltransferase